MAENLIRKYARDFDDCFRPYEGLDEPLGFEPEDFPLVLCGQLIIPAIGMRCNQAKGHLWACAWAKKGWSR